MRTTRSAYTALVSEFYIFNFCRLIIPQFTFTVVLESQVFYSLLMVPCYITHFFPSLATFSIHLSCFLTMITVCCVVTFDSVFYCLQVCIGKDVQ
ncbi:hypothetical protein QL285_006951 [Trifolium repens]|nr:hypothetical protein QL285_006951 [Trifolium repens]